MARERIADQVVRATVANGRPVYPDGKSASFFLAAIAANVPVHDILSLATVDALARSGGNKDVAFR